MTDVQLLLLRQSRRLAGELASELTGPQRDQADILVALLASLTEVDALLPARPIRNYGGGPDAA